MGHAALSAFDPAIHPSKQVWQAELRNSPTRVQWDPERDRNGSPLAWRSLQIGLSKDMVSRYVHEWIVDMQDITPTLLHRRNVSMPLPVERPFPIPAEIAAKIGVTDTPDLQHLQTQ